MDDPQLQRLIELQTEQNQLLRKYLWRLRFSLLALLFLMTFVAVGLGVTFATVRSLNQLIAPQPITVSPYLQLLTPAPSPYAPPQPTSNSDDDLFAIPDPAPAPAPE
jgi:hypothetical protein